jgi:hypothetical protein
MVMAMEERLERLRRWLDSLVVDQGGPSASSRANVIELSTSDELDDPKLLQDFLKASVRSQWQEIAGEVGNAKGIYVWFWPSKGGEAVWPLYVGKSQRGQSCFRSRTFTHLTHARLGVDSLYSWSRSAGQPKLHRIHAAGEPLNCLKEHGERIRDQFNGMRILTLPMADHEARDLASDAEALVLAAMLEMHKTANPFCSTDKAWDRVMNSFGRTGSISSVKPLWADAGVVLSACLAQSPMIARS